MPYRNGQYIPVTRDNRHSKRIDVGLAVLSIVNRPPEPLTRRIIADVCECTVEMIRQYEERGLRKIRRKLSPDEWETLFQLFIRDRRPAKRNHVQIALH